MSAIKSIIAMIACGLSAITLFPNTDYGKYIPANGQDVFDEAWHMTGQSMKKAIDEVKVDYEQQSR